MILFFVAFYGWFLLSSSIFVYLFANVNLFASFYMNEKFNKNIFFPFKLHLFVSLIVEKKKEKKITIE